MRRVWLLSFIVLSSCAVAAEERSRTIPRDKVPFGLLNRDAPPLIPGPGSGPVHTVALCFVEGDTLVITPQATTSPPRPLQVIEALTAAPPAADRPLRTAVGDPGVVRAIGVQGGIATVDLRSSISAIGGADQLLAVAQIVCTLTGLPGIGQVSFTLEGAPVEVPRGDGSLVSAPVSHDDYRGLLP